MPLFFSPSKGRKAISLSILASIAYLLILIDPTAVLLAGNAKDVPGLSIHQVKKLLHNSDVIIIDVRRHRNWWRSTKKILSSVRENPSDPDQWAAHYPKDKSLIFY